jgi:hypothetical protein
MHRIKEAADAHTRYKMKFNLKEKKMHTQMRKNCIHNQRGNTRTSLEKMLLSIREEHTLIKAEMHTPMREKCTSVKGMH